MATHSSILAWRILWIEKAWAGYSPWDGKESDMTEQLTQPLIKLQRRIYCQVFISVSLVLLHSYFSK